MAITKTGITLSATGEADKTFELDGQQSTVSATGLTPNKQYTVAAYIVDSGYGKIDATQTSTFSTLPEGQVSLSNITAEWQTNTAQLNFRANWVSTYKIEGQGVNFQIFMSDRADFVGAEVVNASYSRENDGLNGTISGYLNRKIPTTPNSAYYIKVQFIDVYGEVRSETLRYNTPVAQTGGTFSFNALIQQDNNVWFPTTTYPNSFTYYPKYKRIVLSTDRWQTITRVSGWYNWPNNGYEIFLRLDPQTYLAEMEIQDIYGNVFRSNQNTEVAVVQPTLVANSYNPKGQIYSYIHLNPNLNYTSASLVYDGNNGGSVNLLPAQETYWLYTDVDDGTYDVYVEVVATNPSYSYTTPSTSVTVTNVGYIEVTDNSAFQNNQMRFEARFQMGKWNVLPDTLDVIIYDENDNEIANFQPSIISGDESAGTIGYNDVIELPEGCEYIYYVVKCENDGGYANQAEVEIDLTQQGS